MTESLTLPVRSYVATFDSGAELESWSAANPLALVVARLVTRHTIAALVAEYPTESERMHAFLAWAEVERKAVEDKRHAARLRQREAQRRYRDQKAKEIVTLDQIRTRLYLEKQKITESVI